MSVEGGRSGREARSTTSTGTGCRSPDAVDDSRSATTSGRRVVLVSEVVMMQWKRRWRHRRCVQDSLADELAQDARLAVQGGGQRRQHLSEVALVV